MIDSVPGTIHNIFFLHVGLMDDQHGPQSAALDDGGSECRHPVASLIQRAGIWASVSLHSFDTRVEHHPHLQLLVGASVLLPGCQAHINKKSCVYFFESVLSIWTKVRHIPKIIGQSSVARAQNEVKCYRSSPPRRIPTIETASVMSLVRPSPSTGLGLICAGGVSTFW